MDMVPKFIMNSGELVRAAAPSPCPTHGAIRLAYSHLKHTLLLCIALHSPVRRSVQALAPGWAWSLF